MHLDLRDGTPLQAGEQNAAQAIADRRAKTPLKRFGNKLAVSCRERFGFALT